jgi:hypothetical protein
MCTLHLDTILKHWAEKSKLRACVGEGEVLEIQRRKRLIHTVLSRAGTLGDDTISQL